MTSAQPSASQIRYGGDYNPEQWPREVWDEDARALDLAAMDTVTLGVFDWALLQPAEDVYDFGLLDEIVAHVGATGRHVVMATATGALPPWLAHAHPEVNRTDFEGRRHVYGQRHNACPSSPVFRRLSAALAGRLAERYAGHPGLVAWHVGNEYGGACYCGHCEAAFRVWLQQRYTTLDRLNEAWNTTFWSHTYTDWEQVVVPNALSEHWRGPNHTAFQGTTLDYLRFTSEAMLASFVDEKTAIRQHDPSTPVTTNFMGMYRPIDYHRWAEHLDLASWDNYPPDDVSHARMALTHDLMRGLKQGAPFWVMEQTPTTTASRDVNPLKRPGVLRLWSWQAVAHGADAVLYFQVRQSRGACEKYHGAVLDHAGRTDTRSFREVAALGAELRRLGDAVLGARTPARVALLFDWDSWWAAEITDGLNRHVRYPQVVMDHHRELWQAGVDLDVVAVDADLSGYDVVVAPLLHVVKGDVADRLEQVVARGGSVLTGFWSGRVDEDTNAFLTDVPGPLAGLLGVRVEETDSQPPGVTNPVALDGLDGSRPDAELVFELLVEEGAEVVGRYTEDFYAGRPAVTRRRHPDSSDGLSGGEAWYVGTALSPDGMATVVRAVLERHGLIGPYADVPDLEHAVRERDGERTSFLLNHSGRPLEVPAHTGGTDLLTGDRVEAGQPLRLGPAGVVVLREDPRPGSGPGEDAVGRGGTVTVVGDDTMLSEETR
ncbi:beta-galactosidase [Auraticoccus monumenti]|uniref:Beta-galactosidase n=1 Tax=Auraticoccus monumenti TaxID=675864 RepID=A0A1G7ASB2_9ACTN|nr:beta-galactosidase [Auraticoccus monumenti]SDE17693.1 beta-galactosidase [Auraticoccus monumenti]